MKLIKYHKKFGKVEVKVLSEDHILLIDESGEERKMLKDFVELYDNPYFFNAIDYLKEKRESIIESIQEEMSNKHYIGGSLKEVMIEVASKVEGEENEKDVDKIVDEIIYGLTDHAAISAGHDDFVEKRKREERSLYSKMN